MAALCLAIFWCAGALILYTYAGYPLLIGLLARLWPRPWIQAEVDTDAPPVDVVVAAYNEAADIADKIENTLALDYPPARLALWVVADGSTDDTATIVASAARAGGASALHLLWKPERDGKAAALARVLPCLQGEFILFTDADSRLPANSLRRLARHLADPRVAAASGSKAIESGSGSEGLYWHYESYLKACDSAVGSVMGVPGEIWLVRRASYAAPEPDVLLEDFVASMRLVAAGRRVVYDPAVRAVERSAPAPPPNSNDALASRRGDGRLAVPNWAPCELRRSMVSGSSFPPRSALARAPALFPCS
jgi:cellulose synthase/poly-beta-1,6-N-acetylglucosamine synthase-like glycosyltransferase